MAPTSQGVEPRAIPGRVSGQVTQEDQIGLAGGINAYGFARGDPIHFADPFGLIVCFRGAGASGLARETGRATGTRFDLRADGCATNVSITDPANENAEDFEELADNPFMTVYFQYGSRGSRNSPLGVEIDKKDVGRLYGLVVDPARPGQCAGRDDAVYTLRAIIAHEFGHAFATFKYTGDAALLMQAFIAENAVDRRDGQPVRNPLCH